MELIHGDCLEIMKEIPNKSIDMILCDLPYGIIGCKWDNVIPFDELWEQYERIIVDNGAIVLFGSEPFSSRLRCSNLKLFKYDWIWKKNKTCGFLNAKNAPLKEYEIISVFSKGKTSNGNKNNMKYYPQGLKEVNKIKHSVSRNLDTVIGTRPSRKGEYISKYTGYPKSILEFQNERKQIHPTQKPVKLLEYLIKTYTIEGNLVLDNCMGSGSTGVACVNTNRNFIGIELEEKYFNIAKERINTAYGKEEGQEDEV